ncbi:MAG: FAD-binding oxidoreductase [Polyangia bacterium]
MTSLATSAPWRVLDGFGRAVQVASRSVKPRDVDELRAVFAHAARDGLPLTFRGSGRSYGDASIGEGGVVVDLTGLDRINAWDPVTGIVDAQPGVTIEGLWRRILGDGWWPRVVPGTMRPTLAGCVSMNVHGKNNFRVGAFGDQLESIDLLSPDGELRTLSRTENTELFRAAVGGLGLLGVITRIRMRTKKVDSGLMRVRARSGRSLDEMFDLFEQHLPDADYLVGWLDCFASGDDLGRGQLHVAHYLHGDEDRDPSRSLDVDKQDLPSSMFGLPKKHLWRVMRPFLRDPFVQLVNWAKFQKARIDDGDTYLQSHVAFAFLLDYVPDWRLAYGPGGFIQYQVFVPDEGARSSLRDVLRICQEEDFTSYLGVMKRHRADDYLLTHALDGWSLAMDFPIRDTSQTRWRERVARVTERLSERVIAAGGRFYFAKDAVLRPIDVQRAFGARKLAEFAAIRRRLDPNHQLTSALAQRVFGG